jgi:hypothetical protein
MEYGPGIVRQGIDRNGDVVIWYHRRAKKTEYAVKIGRRKKPETVRLACPHLLARLVRRAGRWAAVTHVYAFSGRLRKSTMLYLPPFPNVFADGKVCMGSVSTNAAAGSKAGEYFEQAFIQSLFSDHVMNPLREKSGYRHILDAIRQRKGRIPLSLLRKGGTYGRLCK